MKPFPYVGKRDASKGNLEYRGKDDPNLGYRDDEFYYTHRETRAQGFAPFRLRTAQCTARETYVEACGGRVTFREYD